MSQPALRKPTATRGDLGEVPFAELLLGLCRDRYDGAISLERDEVRKDLLWQRGLPVMVESNLSGESLAKTLLDREMIDRDQHAKILAATRDRRGVSEGAAVLALDCVDAVDMVRVLRGLIRQRLIECFGWTRGQFREREDAEVPSDAAALRCDPVSVALEGVAIHWSPTRIREALAPAASRFPHPTPATANLVDRLGADPDTRAVCEALDGTRPLGEALAEASPVAWAAALVLERVGAWTLRGEPFVADADADAEEDAAPALPDYEIVIGAGPEPEAEQAAQTSTGGTATPSAEASPEADAFRAEVLELHHKLEELDHYQVLGVEEKAGSSAVKRSYFKLAKRFHPDALARLGVEDVKDQAKEVFARIAAAYDVLKDAERRREYDGSRAHGGDDLDAARLIQAESLFRKGEIMLGAGNFQGALEFLEPAVELWPEESEYQCALGWALFRKSPADLERARRHLELAVETGPKNAVAHQRLGLVLRALDDHKGADAALARAKVLDPKL